MQCSLILLGIFSVIGYITCLPPPPGEDGMLCYHCGGRGHDHFPACLSETHHCRHGELCYMSDHDGHFKSECWSSHDCTHEKNCLLNQHTGSCGTCCSDQHCLNRQLASFQGLTPVTTTVAPATPKPTQPTTTVPTTPMSLMDKIMIGECKDDVELDGCKTLGSSFCIDHVGITLCPETCGLCSSLKNRFHGNITCHDTLLDNACMTENSQQFCQSAVGEVACPRTCNLCDNIVDNMILAIIGASKSTLPTTAATTQPPPTTTTAATMPAATTTIDPCHDDLDYCDTMDDVCGNDLGPTICRKTCGFCGDGTVVVPVTQGTTGMPTMEATTAMLTPLELLQTGVCRDSVQDGGCSNTAVYCQDTVGVSLCPLTCGLCNKIMEEFHGSTTCSDQVNCTVNDCPLSLGKCPKTCDQCNGIITRLIQATVDEYKTNMLPPTTPPTAAPTTAAMPKTTVSMTTVAVSGTTALPACHDDLLTCDTIGDICSNAIGPKICKKFCNLCGADNQTTTDLTTPGVSVVATNAPVVVTNTPVVATNAPVVATGAPSKMTTCLQCGDIDNGTVCTGLDEVLPPSLDCPAGSHYCITDLILDVQKNPAFVRRCATRDRCSKDWWDRTSSEPVCIDSDPTQLRISKTCSYCCTGDDCNRGDIPDKSTFFKP